MWDIHRASWPEKRGKRGDQEQREQGPEDTGNHWKADDGKERGRDMRNPAGNVLLPHVSTSRTRNSRSQGRTRQGCCEIHSLARSVQKIYISASVRMFYFKKHNPWRHLGFLGLALCITDLFSYSSANVMLFSVYASATGRKLWPAAYTAYQTWSHQLFSSSLLSVLGIIQHPMSWEQGSPGALSSHLFKGFFRQPLWCLSTDESLSSPPQTLCSQMSSCCWNTLKVRQGKTTEAEEFFFP